MILDAELEFSVSQAITATADATNVIDLGVARDVGEGEELYVFVNVTETFADAGSDGTVAIALVTDDNAALTSDATVRTLTTLPALTAAGTLLFFRLEPNQLAAGHYQRYLGLTYTVANGPLTAGKISAGIIKDISQFKAYAKNFVVA
jgi:hypothetical protein